ncbi:ABC transporter substrate-binding protein [Novosphingobium guangzhouense]|uniref:ABC transporter substrate-binding protein n=1 Tax=Novosphingobium guangzhouense TaxID=1850347 RepID=A0A2K2G240_9SPHN|nr:ABC transporter substrate-binding protein [Novosphingobium guangzhouense]PNU05103.1 ABC transporter substrate-binding protein [Novosphingobium guangzhouense]
MAASVKIGILNDIADFTGEDPSAPEGSRPVPGDITGWIEREIDALRQSGRFDADVELIHAYALGLPSGTAEAVEHAYRQLAESGVSLIVGPAIGDNALVATPLAEQLRMPTINWAGAERARGRWMFQHQVGSHEDESLVIARQMASLGRKRLAVIYDLSPIGTRHLKYLDGEARVLGMEIATKEGISPLADDVYDIAAMVLKAAPDGVVYLGLGLSAPAVSRALDRAGWDGPRIMNTAGLRGYHGDFAHACNGWLYIDMHSDANSTLKAVMDRMEAPRRQALAVAKGHDIGRLVAEGLARASDFTREGVRGGLEQVKWLPAAEGHEGTLLGFGAHDRGALHGRYLVVRQWLDGETREVAA